MWDLKACLVCLRTNRKLLNLNVGRLKKDYFMVSGVQAKDCQGLPQYLCVECSTTVSRFRKFRDRCKRAHYALKTLLLSNKEISEATLEQINRESIGILPPLSYVNLEKMHYEEMKFQWVKHNRIGIGTTDNIPVFHCGTFISEDEYQVPMKRIKVGDSSPNDFIKEETEISLQSELECIENDTQKILVEEPSSAIDNECLDYLFDNEDNFDDQELNNIAKVEDRDTADGSSLDEEYASMIPISLKEAKAVVEVYKLFSKGTYRCQCGKTFHKENHLTTHSRKHDQLVSGNFLCVLCNFYYKTEFLLKTHMTEKHMYKYVCRKCPEVNFDRTSAKQHFIWTHLKKGSKKGANWYECRPTWLANKGGGVKGITVATLRPVRRLVKLPDDFPVYSPVGQEEQYAIVQERRKSRNYLEAQFKCELCFRGFREMATYSKHMRKHDPATAGPMQCDMCKLHFRDARKMYKHMIITHLFKYSCQTCSYVCYNRGQAQSHYRWHKNVKYQCPHCDKEFMKASTQLTHVRIKHPSMYICSLCGHSFVSLNGLYCHKKLAHSKEEIEASEQASIDPSHPHYCVECKVQFLSDAAYKTHLGSSSKHSATNTSIKKRSARPPREGRATRTRGRPRLGASEIVNTGVPTPTQCDLCDKVLSNDVQARKHYEAEHPGHDFLKRYMCDVCGHTTRQYANLMVHMRTHTNEKPYGCPHCGRRFSMPSNRDRHLVVHTGEKKYQCQHCSRRFTQSSAVKLHIQTVHLKIPYAPWDKKNRKRRKELEGAAVPLSCAPLPPAQKLVLEPQPDYLSAYITYNDE